MTSAREITIRFNFRIEIQKTEDTEPEAALLMQASQTKLVWRSSSEFQQGDKVLITGDPSFHDSFRFWATVTECLHTEVSEAKMNFFEISTEVLPIEKEYVPFLKRLRQTCHEMKDDLRLDVSLPVSLRIDGQKTSTWCNNVSFGGLFLILKDTPLPKLKDILDLSISIYGKETPMLCSGNVCYVINEKQAASMNISPGAGIRLNLNDEENFYWEETIRALHKKALG